MCEGHMCFFKSPIITTKIGGFGRAPLSPPNPTSHPTSHPTVSNRLQPSPSPNTWHRNGTTAEALALVLFRFTTSRPEIWSTTNDWTLRGEIESMFWFVVVLVKPPTSWKSEDFIYNTICICIDMFLFVQQKDGLNRDRLWLLSVFTSWPNKFTAGIIKVSKIWSLRLLAIRPTHSASSPDRLVEQSTRALHNLQLCSSGLVGKIMPKMIDIVHLFVKSC